MQKLSKDEMKKVLGGVLQPTVDTVYCNDGSTASPPEGDCSCGSVGTCDGHGGVVNCIAYGHPILK
jgi:hypothetical protein